MTKAFGATLLAALLLVSCAPAVRPPAAPGAPVETVVRPSADETKKAVDIEAFKKEYAVINPAPEDTYESLAQRYYGDRSLAYLISDINNNGPLSPSKPVIVPLKSVNPGGIHTDGYQTVTVLCYHHFHDGKSSNKLSVSRETLDRQLAYLRDNGYTVITLGMLRDFLEYRRRPPKKSVLITIDDGWKSVKTVAAPTLKKYGYKAVLFVYTDLVKAKPNNTTLCWDDLKEMIADGVLDVQSHSVSHPDLTRVDDEKLELEIGESRRVIADRLGITSEFMAYPYGTVNDKVVETMQKHRYRFGFTVIRGGNAFFYNHYSLNRTMLYNNDNIEEFAKLLETFKAY